MKGDGEMRLAFKIAARFLKSSKGQTILIVLGIAIGVSVQVFIGTLIQGLQKSLIDKTVGSSSQITVTSKNDDKLIKDWNSKIKDIKSLNVGINSVSAVADSSGFIKKGDKTEPILLRGFTFPAADSIYKISSNIVDGTKPSSNNEILVGKDLKKDMGLKLGDKVTILTPQGTKQEVKITGFYDLKVSSINKSWIITNLKTAQTIFNFGDNITSIEMQVNDVFNADIIATDIKNKLNESNLNIDNWKVENAATLSGLSGQSASSIMIQVFVLISVILGIASVLAITVMQKSKQLGILKAMGIKDRVASLIFLFEGLILGIFGAIFGVLIGLGLTYSFTKFALNPDGTPLVPLYFDYKFIVLSAFIAVASSTIAALIPAIKSSKLNPIEVIKNG